MADSVVEGCGSLLCSVHIVLLGKGIISKVLRFNALNTVDLSLFSQTTCIERTDIALDATEKVL